MMKLWSKKLNESLATIDLREGLYFVCTWHCTTDGVWIMGAECFKLEESMPVDELGQSILAALSKSKRVPHPKVWNNELVKPLLKLARVRSMRTFANGALHVTVSTKSANITVTPSRNGGTVGPDRGIHAKSDQEITLRKGSTAEQLGQAIKDAFTFCE